MYMYHKRLISYRYYNNRLYCDENQISDNENHGLSHIFEISKIIMIKNI